jgi:hypothetical protein
MIFFSGHDKKLEAVGKFLGTARFHMAVYKGFPTVFFSIKSAL